MDRRSVVSAKNHLASIAALASPSGWAVAEGERLKGRTDGSIALKERWNGWNDGTTALMATGINNRTTSSAMPWNDNVRLPK